MSKVKSIFNCMGAANFAKEERQNEDFYATDPKAIDDLKKFVTLSHGILEPSVGAGHLANRLIEMGHSVVGIDIVDRGWPNTIIMDFMDYKHYFTGDIVMNPPYTYAKEHICKALNHIEKGHKVCAILKIQFLESFSRKSLFDEFPPKYILVYRGRMKCAKNGIFTDKMTSAMMFAWFVWEKGFKGDPKIKWIDRD